jgi:hypothetical protein
MAWTYGGIRIFVQTEDESTSQTIARLQPLSGETIKQYFGWEEEILKITAYVVGEQDANVLKYMCQSSGTASNLYYDTTYIGAYVLHSYSKSRKMSVSQTLRADLDCTAPVYLVEMELYPE